MRLLNMTKLLLALGILACGKAMATPVPASTEKVSTEKQQEKAFFALIDKEYVAVELYERLCDAMLCLLPYLGDKALGSQITKLQEKLEKLHEDISAQRDVFLQKPLYANWYFTQDLRPEIYWYLNKDLSIYKGIHVNQINYKRIDITKAGMLRRHHLAQELFTPQSFQEAFNQGKLSQLLQDIKADMDYYHNRLPYIHKLLGDMEETSAEKKLFQEVLHIHDKANAYIGQALNLDTIKPSKGFHSFPRKALGLLEKITALSTHCQPSLDNILQDVYKDLKKKMHALVKPLKHHPDPQSKVEYIVCESLMSMLDKERQELSQGLRKFVGDRFKGSSPKEKPWIFKIAQELSQGLRKFVGDGFKGSSQEEKPWILKIAQDLEDMKDENGRHPFRAIARTMVAKLKNLEDKGA